MRDCEDCCSRIGVSGAGGEEYRGGGEGEGLSGGECGEEVRDEGRGGSCGGEGLYAEWRHFGEEDQDAKTKIRND